MKKQIGIVLTALLLCSGCQANQTEQTQGLDEELVSQWEQAFEKLDEQTHYQTKSEQDGTYITLSDESQTALTTEEIHMESVGQVYASDEWTYYFSYGDTCSLRRENDEVVEEALNFFFHNDELKADEVYFPFTDSDALIYTKYEPQENYDITRFRAIKEDPTGWSLTKTQENGNTILTLKIEDPQAYNDYLGTNEPTQIAGVDVDKCEVVCNETIIAVDEDGNIVRYESNVETDYGNGLISHNHYVAEYKYSDLDVEVFTPQESDQLIEQAKALQEEIDQ